MDKLNGSASKRKRVEQYLRGREDLVIVEILETDQLDSDWAPASHWTQTSDIIVAPKKGIYDAEGLQEFMAGLVPDGVEPTCRDEFWAAGRTINFGKLYFDEEIGKSRQTTELELTDPSLAGYKGYEGGKRTLNRDEQLMRRTWVSVYPCVRYAQDVLAGKNEFGKYSGNKEVLRKYQKAELPGGGEGG